MFYEPVLPLDTCQRMAKLDAMAKNTHDQQVGLRMDTDVVKALERIATDMDVSVSWVIRRACQQFIQRYQASKSEAADNEFGKPLFSK